MNKYICWTAYQKRLKPGFLFFFCDKRKYFAIQFFERIVTSDGKVVLVASFLKFECLTRPLNVQDSWTFLPLWSLSYDVLTTFEHTFSSLLLNIFSSSLLNTFSSLFLNTFDSFLFKHFQQLSFWTSSAVHFWTISAAYFLNTFNSFLFEHLQQFTFENFQQLSFWTSSAVRSLILNTFISLLLNSKNSNSNLLLNIFRSSLLNTFRNLFFEF